MLKVLMDDMIIVFTSDWHHFNRKYVEQDIMTLCETFCIYDLKPRGDMWSKIFHRL